MIQRELSDPRVPTITSVTRVKVAEDLSVADVYVSMMATEGQQTAALNALRSSAGIMRTRLTKALNTRTTPFLKFHIDEGLKKEVEILALLHKVSEENAEADRRRAAAAAAAEQQGQQDGQPRQQSGQAERPESPSPQEQERQERGGDAPPAPPPDR